MDERLDALLEDVQDALKEVQVSNENILQDLGDGDELRRKLEKNNSKLHEVLSLIGYFYSPIILNSSLYQSYYLLLYCAIS